MTEVNGVQALEFHVDRRTTAVNAGISLTVAAFFCVVAVRGRGTPTVTAIVPVLLSLKFAHDIYQLLRPTAALTIDDRGIDERRAGMRLIPWAEIRGATVGKVGRDAVLILDVDHAETYLDRLSLIPRLRSRFGRVRSNGNRIVINFAFLVPRPQTAAEAIEKRLLGALSGPAARCRECGYDLQASPDRCPECGTPTRGI